MAEVAGPNPAEPIVANVSNGPQCYFCKLHEHGTKCAKYDQIAPEILVNLSSARLKKMPSRGGQTRTKLDSVVRYRFIFFVGPCYQGGIYGEVQRGMKSTD